MSSSKCLLHSQVDHIVLQPRLPAKREENLIEVENALNDRLVGAVKSIRDSVSHNTYGLWDGIRRVLVKSKSLNVLGSLDKQVLLEELRSLEHGSTLILHVAEQNAGLLIRRPEDFQGPEVIFEAFEASARGKDVLAASGSLQWDFFSSGAVALPYSTFSDCQFQQELAVFLEQCSTESIKRFALYAKKAGVTTYESRDTVDPAMVTSMLITLLEALGRRTCPPGIRKRIKDDICWADGAEIPWRRSARWLVLRIGLLRHLTTTLGEEMGQAHYKFIMARLLAELLEDCIGHNLAPDSITVIKAKLARRLAKLEERRQNCVSSCRSLYDEMFDAFTVAYEQVLKSASHYVNSEWESFKFSTQRRVRLLPRRAHPEDLVLSLPNSIQHLCSVLIHASPSIALRNGSTYAKDGVADQSLHSVAKRYYALSDMESEIEDMRDSSYSNNDTACIELSENLEKYLDAVGDAYDDDSVQNSLMILTAMELWVRIDRLACASYELLLDYHPGFTPENLDVLLLPRFGDMVRLQSIQAYLSERQSRCNSAMTIFNDPVTGCLGERYFNESTDFQRLRQLHDEIKQHAERARARKRVEWSKMRDEFEDLQRRIAAITCLYYERSGVHNQKRCTKCYLRRKSRRMKIEVHEDPLPSYPVHAKVVIFELCCPQTLAVYRYITWRIMFQLGHDTRICGCARRQVQAQLRLDQYQQLARHQKAQWRGLGLASTKKSFLETHYRGIKFPVDIESICLPNGLSLRYYDAKSCTWTGDYDHPPSFHHLCRVVLPAKSPFASLERIANSMLSSNGPSSNEIIASQTACPVQLNVHEHMAFQNLCSGVYRRWPNILVELGSANLNFSKEETTSLVRQVVYHAGPGYGTDPLRKAHQAFLEDAFCNRLTDQINQRLKIISTNWRENNAMESFLTIILRLASIVPKSHCAIELLEEARSITLGWIRQLKQEIYSTKDADSSQNYSRYALWAALLCRRTFDRHVELKGTLDQRSLECFVECSIALRDNFEASDMKSQAPLLQMALIRDMKMVRRMQFLLKKSFEAHPSSLTHVIDKIWAQPHGLDARKYSDAEFRDTPSGWWIQLSTLRTEHTKEQIIHYNLLSGHLLIDNKPLGRLPAEHRKHVTLEELFGTQNLLTYPSSLQHMTYVLALTPENHQIHIGFRDGDLIVQAHKGRDVLEFIHRSKFGSAAEADLPSSLLEDCVHWLNIRTGILEVRQRSNIWRSKISNWKINMRTKRALRRESTLIDLRSSLFQQIAGAFNSFEHPQYLTAYSTNSGIIHVELKRLQLNFTIDARGRLYCRELRSVIDLNQDALTWYGLDSKLVLCDKMNPRLRSIIVPLGNVIPKRRGIHVQIELEKTGEYGRFFINDVLGRIDCAAEPRLVYFKAMLHAYTSTVLPDPLTGRTGTEEAIHWLKSGICQPWTPINPHIGPYLVQIAGLSPSRIYYPKGMKVMQRVIWNPDLTNAIQHESFGPLIDTIYEKSNQLSVFEPHKRELPPLPDCGDPHLRQRGYFRRRLYERPTEEDDIAIGTDRMYHPRDGDVTLRSNVFHVTTLLRSWSPEMNFPKDLAMILERWPEIRGFGQKFDKPLLSDLLKLDFATEWCPLVSHCAELSSIDRYQLHFLLGTISFQEGINMDLMRVLIAFAVQQKLKNLSPPAWPSYSNFRKTSAPTMSQLTRLIEPFQVDIVDIRTDNSGSWSWILNAEARRKSEIARAENKMLVDRQITTLAAHLLAQWPCDEPNVDGLQQSSMEPLRLDIPKALAAIRLEWLRLFRNFELSRYVSQVQLTLDETRVPDTMEIPPIKPVESFSSAPLMRSKGISRVCRPCSKFPSPSPIKSLLLKDYFASHSGQSQSRRLDVSSSKEIQELQQIIRTVSASKSTVRQNYAADLRRSVRALIETQTEDSHHPGVVFPEGLPWAFSKDLRNAISEAENAKEEYFSCIVNALQDESSGGQWMKLGGMFPRITTVSLLARLRSNSMAKFGRDLKEAIVNFGLSVTTLQHLLRIEDAQSKGTPNIKKICEELGNEGHVNWSPFEFPDWLLLEIETNILIRPSQIEVARATINPDSGSNSVLQMNMGQGKTSVIIPMVAAVLADTKKLVRIVVPKALLLQTAQLMHARLGGLLGRTVSHIPFSRKISTSPQTVDAYDHLHKKLMGESGVLVTLPEHIMSFMLSGLQCLSDSKVREADAMIRVQNWLSTTSRDILDESDALLAVRTQLIYPSGQQTTVDGHPHRWETVQAILKQVQGHLWRLKEEFPHSIEILSRPGDGFPIISLLRNDVEEALLSRIAGNIISGQTSILPIKDCTAAERCAIGEFITEADVKPNTVDLINSMDSFTENDAAKQNLYLARGLLVHRILLLALKKRWNVQYGLHPQRDPIAVPYSAKGVPSDQSEWGHPDVAILFTCLSFYFAGLSKSQLSQAFQHLVRADDPTSRYDHWIQMVPEIPGHLRDWHIINVDDEIQLTDLWKYLAYNTTVIDYFLNHFVFPCHAKQFEIKIQASGWDIPLIAFGKDVGSNRMKSLTTGFSGTNDNRTMLPLTIKQEDLHTLAHTNAEVLTCLLSPRNRGYVLAADTTGRRLSEEGFLQMLKSKRIRILIDAGAHVLEMNNLTLARTWLRVDNEAKAALYFDSINRPMILYRTDKIIPLLASPFAEDLRECLVYIDEAHTRGTDLKLPPGSQGAVTLGLGQTKDHTVQAAMRMRDLAKSQSILFVATPDVHQSVLDYRKNPSNGQVDSHDVICWLIEQTCIGIEQLQPLYYSQGVDFCQRSQAALSNPSFLKKKSQRRAYLSALRQEERQTLEQLYHIKHRNDRFCHSPEFTPEIAVYMEELEHRRQGFQDFGNAVHEAALQEVEQEREMEIEVETVREVQKPKVLEPLIFSATHPDIVKFAETGQLAPASSGYEHLLSTLRRTALGRKHQVHVENRSSKLFVSMEYLRTVCLSEPNDNYLRPVTWLLWSQEIETAMIVTPEEVEELIPVIMNDSRPRTHILTYSAPITRRMLYFNEMTYYTVPALPPNWRCPTWLKVELGVFSGQRYFKFEDYADICKYIGHEMSPDSKVMESTEIVEEKGLLQLAKMTQNEHRSFIDKPLAFLQEWLAIRRNGQEFTHTPMGYICQGKPLSVNHPFFTAMEGVGWTPRDVSSPAYAISEPDVSSEDEIDEDDEDDGLHEDSEMVK